MAEILLSVACILFGIALFILGLSGFWEYIIMIFVFGGIILAFYGFYKEHKG